MAPTRSRDSKHKTAADPLNDMSDLQRQIEALPEKLFIGAALILRSAEGQPVERPDIVQATLEVIHYKRTCSILTNKLDALQPIALPIDCPALWL